MKSALGQSVLTCQSLSQFHSVKQLELPLVAYKCEHNVKKTEFNRVSEVGWFIIDRKFLSSADHNTNFHPQSPTQLVSFYRVVTMFAINKYESSNKKFEVWCAFWKPLRNLIKQYQLSHMLGPEVCITIWLISKLIIDEESCNQSWCIYA